MRHANSSSRQIIHLIATSFLFAAASVLDLRAQSTSATLTGTVTDSSAAVVPGATITAVNVNTAAERVAITDETGRYQIQNLDAGPYRITVARPGCREQRRDADRRASRTVRVDTQLATAGTTETVQVVAATPIIETDRATLDTSKSGADINRLALNFRATNNTS